MANKPEVSVSTPPRPRSKAVASDVAARAFPVAEVAAFAIFYLATIATAAYLAYNLRDLKTLFLHE